MTDFNNDKLGGLRGLVQIDNTILNHKCKSHRGRSPSNKTDSLCIIEFEDSITRAYATVIERKRAETIIPIICSQDACNSTIYTDEHKSYCSLNNYHFIHGKVCHKYEFLNSETGVNTQAIESLNNKLKREIKNKKGVKTNAKSNFLRVLFLLQ